MFDNLKNLAGLMGQMGELRAKAEKMQEELAKKTVEGDAGAGAVRVVMNGKLDVLSVHLDRPLVAAMASGGGQADHQVIENLIAAAFNDACAKAREMIRQEMSRATGGLNIPGLDKLLGG